MVTTSPTVTGRASLTVVDWSTNEMRRGRPSTGSTSTRPELGSTSPATALSTVDLPDPFGPMTAVTAPSGISKSERSKASTSP